MGWFDPARAANLPVAGSDGARRPVAADVVTAYLKDERLRFQLGRRTWRLRLCPVSPPMRRFADRQDSLSCAPCCAAL